MVLKSVLIFAIAVTLVPPGQPKAIGQNNTPLISTDWTPGLEKNYQRSKLAYEITATIWDIICFPCAIARLIMETGWKDHLATKKTLSGNMRRWYMDQLNEQELKDFLLKEQDEEINILTEKMFASLNTTSHD
jgi:hypothetical protein